MVYSQASKSLAFKTKYELYYNFKSEKANPEISQLSNPSQPMSCDQKGSEIIANLQIMYTHLVFFMSPG